MDGETMSRPRKVKGRPPQRLFPPRIDATPEELVRVVLRSGKPNGRVRPKNYYCGGCKRQVAYPEILYNDNLCEACHAAA